MGLSTEDAASVRAPAEGQGIVVTATSANTATVAIAHGAGNGQYVAIGCDDETATLPAFWVYFGAGTMGTPVRTAVSGDTRVMGPYQGVVHLKPGSAETHYRVISTAAGYVRSYPSSHGGTK